MSTILETELRRARWRRSLETEAIDRIDREDFGQGGLGSRVEDRYARLLLLPSDPDTECVEFDDKLWEWLQTHKSMALGDGEIQLGDRTAPTAHAAALITVGGWPEVWQSYIAVHRSGAIDFELGSRGGTTRTDSNGGNARHFFLVPIVARIWALIELARGLAQADRSGPLLLTVALQNTKGALLDQLGNGWLPSWDPRNTVGGCPEENLLWHIELDQMPENQAMSQALALSVGDRIENSWGNRQKLYIDQTGGSKGELNIQRA